MKLSPKEQQELIKLYRTVRASMGTLDEAAAELVAIMHDVRPAEVLALAFFDGNPQPPRPSRAGVVIPIRRLA